MSVKKNELQMISIERERVRQRDTRRQAQTQIYRQRTSKNVRRRKKRRQRTIRKFCIVAVFLCLCIIISRGKINFLPQSSEADRFLKQMKEENYPQELIDLLERNEETLDFVENYPKREKYINQNIDLSKDYKQGKVPLLIQWDKRWGYEMYGDSMIGLAGCGPTCLTMAYLYYTGDMSMNPKKMSEFAQQNGYHTADGTSWNLWTDGAEQIGLHGESLSLNENTMKAALDAGELIVCSMAPGDFTTTGHFILLRGYNEKGFFVNDPNSKNNSRKQWDYDTLSPQIKNLWALYR